MAGCHVLANPSSKPIQDFSKADPISDAVKEFEKNEPKFLGWNGGSMEPFFVPGLSKDEVSLFINSKMFECVTFHYYHLDFAKKNSKKGKYLEAKMKYAETFNIELMRLVKQKVAYQISSPNADKPRG